MSSPLVLSFDLGTQSIKALLVDAAGATVGRVVRRFPVPYLSPQPNRAEQDPEMYYRALCELSCELRRSYPEEFSRIACLVLTTFRDSYVCLDRSGKVLRPAILWPDQRKASKSARVSPLKSAAFRLAGVSETIDLLGRTCMCNWLAENEPEIWEKTDKFILISTYLNFRLTGRLVDSAACQIAHLPFDYKNRCWDEKGITRSLYNVPNDKLCDLLPSGTVIGTLTTETAALSGLPQNLPLVSTAADKACETTGLGVLGSGMAALSYGTSCTVELTSPRYFEPSPFMPAYPALPNNLYNGELQLWRGYWMVTWFIENFGEKEQREAEVLGCRPEELLDAKLSGIPAGSDGLLVLPHWTPCLTTPDARGAVIGFTDAHTKYHLYRAIIEGLNYGLMEGLYGMEKRLGDKVSLLRVAGGGSRSDGICALTADMFGLPVERIQTDDAGALGAAMCGFIFKGEFSDYSQAAEAMVHPREPFLPHPETRPLYEALYREVYSDYYKTVRPLHRRINRFIK